MEWLFTTRLGRTVLLAAVMTVSAFATYFYVDGKAYNRGKREAEAACESKQSAAKTDLLNSRADQSQSASQISQNAANETAAEVGKINTQTNTDKEKNHEEYRAQPPAVACVDRPAPAGVQARIDAAVERDAD